MPCSRPRGGPSTSWPRRSPPRARRPPSRRAPALVSPSTSCTTRARPPTSSACFPPSTPPGADDTASGPALVVGLARAFAAAGGVDRTLVFVLFGAEELGLLGSGHYVREPVVPLAQTIAMLNFDIVGRLRRDRL